MNIQDTGRKQVGRLSLKDAKARTNEAKARLRKQFPTFKMK